MNKARTIASTGVRTVSGDSGILDNSDADAGQFTIDITAASGTTPTATFTIEGIDPESGKAYPILVSTALTSISTTVLRVSRGLGAAANLVANDFLPKQFRVKWVIAGTTPSFTFSVGATLNG